MREHSFLKLTLILFIVINLLISCDAKMGFANMAKVAILPLQMNADEDIEYINRGVRDMLASRITYGNHIAVVEQSVLRDVVSKLSPGEVTKKVIQEIGSTLGIDYVIFGSITKIGKNVSIDIYVVSVLQEGGTLPVFARSFGLDELIPEMSRLAQGVRDAIAKGFKSLPPETTTVQPPEADKKFSEEGSEVSKGVPEKIKEVDLTEGDRALEEARPPSGGDLSEIKKEDESLSEQSTKKEGLKKNYLKRKSEIDSLSENPVYQRSVDDLEKISEAESGMIPR